MKLIELVSLIMIQILPNWGRLTGQLGHLHMEYFTVVAYINIIHSMHKSSDWL